MVQRNPLVDGAAIVRSNGDEATRVKEQIRVAFILVEAECIMNSSFYLTL